MTLNPISFAQEVNKQFIRYQLTAFPLSDPSLSDQAKIMFSKSISKDSPFFKGPYLSLARTFAEGDELKELVNQGKLHSAVEGIIKFPQLFLHQQRALEAVKDDHHCLITTGTGSGKTEAFLIPILDYCFRQRDSNASEGIIAIIIYPMNALAADQLSRLRTLLAGTGISFGMYVGSTPNRRDDVTDTVQMQEGEGPEKYTDYYERYRDHKDITIAPWEERLSREEIAENPPRILLTNVNQLEFLMTRGKDVKMFLNAPLRFIILDEGHTYTGATGAEVACLLRRLRTFCGKSADDVNCISTSATIIDPSTDEQPGARFMNRLFGIDASKVRVISEEYEEVSWPEDSFIPPTIGEEATTLFPQILQALDVEADPSFLTSLVLKLTGRPLDSSKPWREALYEHLKTNKIVKAIYEEVIEPLHLEEATKRVFETLNRPYDELEDATSEILCYLGLGVAADKQGPVLRPKLHYFVRGLRGASVILKSSSKGDTIAELFFTADKAIEKYPNLLPSAIFPLLVCVNCGQHYFETWLAGIESEDQGLTGGFAEENNVFWSRVDEEDGVRFLFTNTFVSETSESEDDAQFKEKLDKKRTDVYICQFCGTIHRHSSDKCGNPKCRRSGQELLKIFIIDMTGKIVTCPSCGHRGRKRGTYEMEPFRPLRAVTVADVHIIAQDLINLQSPGHRKTIIFSDNRQDAAFQAAWMAQRARRYRFRHLIYTILNNNPNPMSIGRLVDHIYTTFQEDRELARTLAPEVYAHESEEAYSSKLQEDLQAYIRILILLEIAMSFRAWDSLETWGIMSLSYAGLSDNTHFSELNQLAKRYNLGIEDLRGCIENLLDVYRRGRHLYDDVCPMFSQYWHPGCKEIQRGFIPSSFASLSPSGLKLIRDPNEKQNLITALKSDKGQTLAENFIQKSEVTNELIPKFLDDVWGFLTQKLQILTPISLKSSRGKALGNVAGTYQIDTRKIGLKLQSERYRCFICQRVHTRQTPKNVCTAYRCNGELVKESPSDDDYNIQLLKREFTMVIAKEHTAQVPAQDRLKIEEQFKKPDNGVNCLVSTPTLELGVDIGDLDVVLLRNVPPLPANYWQRAGRAGRRHRMAVVYTYCRKSIHDDYFFEDPLRILSEKITIPKFTLKNNVMIEKHTNAIIISHLSALKHSNGQSEQENEAFETFSKAVPAFISSLLFESSEEGSKRRGRRYRRQPFDLTKFQQAFEQIKTSLEEPIFSVFQEYWASEAAEEVTPEKLREYLSKFVPRLKDHYNQLYNQLMWTIQTRNRILDKEKDIGTLEEFDSRLLKRCRDWIRDIQRPSLDNYTLTVLSRMGFLPTYGTSSGNIIAFAGVAFSTTWRSLTFQLNRSPSIALFEYAPGNLIYANGGKYRNALIHLPVGDDVIEPTEYLLDLESDRIFEKETPVPGYAEEDRVPLLGIPISDIDLAFLSHVTDEEHYRFRMPAYIVGYRQPLHRGGQVHNAGKLEIQHYRGQKIRLVNAGPAAKITQGQFGYPVCIVCGATRSPFASQAEISKFKEYHGEKSCKLVPEHYALSADAEVDGLLFKGFESKVEAVNFAESIRMGASILLEMNRDDLQLLVLPLSSEEFDVFLYDPMPGGSGLLDQIIDNWVEVCQASLSALNCPNQCLESCYACMKTYRNMIYHTILNRGTASQLVQNYTLKINSLHKIPAQLQIDRPESIDSTNLPEKRLYDLLLRRGFPPFETQKAIAIAAGTIKSTTPDLVHEDPVKGVKVAIYLDGLSKGIHGNKQRQQIDQLIRLTLKQMGYKVISMPSSALDDPAMIELYLQEISMELED